jgi:hypothetical protein
LVIQLQNKKRSTWKSDGWSSIDEAYYLYKPDNERDYGSEAIEIYYKLWKINDDLVVILAGYKEPMDKFYESNPGLSSRIANHIDFPD